MAYKSRRVNKTSEEEKERKATLRDQLKVASEYHRDRLRLIFFVAITAGTIFSAMMALYISQKGNPDDFHLYRLKSAIAWSGIYVSLLSLLAQVLSIKAYRFFGRAYLIPIARDLGIMPDLSEEDIRERKDIEMYAAIGLYGMCVIYFALWVLVLHLDLKVFG